MTTYKNLNGHPIVFHDDGRYLNLPTSRFILQPRQGQLSSPKYRIAGSREEIELFAELNKLSKSEVLANCGIEVEERTTFFFCFPIGQRNHQRIFSQPTSTSEIDKVISRFEGLHLFSLEGLFSKVYLSRIIDGDTVEGVVYVPFSFLTEVRSCFENGHVVRRTMAIPSYTESKNGFFSKFMIRLYGIDAMESNTREGKAATEILISKLPKNKILWGWFHGNEKYGRQLVEFFYDEKRKKPLNFELLKNPKNFEIYFGGTKSDYSKGL